MKKIRHKFKKINAKYHLKHICPKCPSHKRHTRDIKHTGKCYWEEIWKKGYYDSPILGIANYFRLYILKKPIKVRINGQICEGPKLIKKNKKK